jgi:cyclopropane-fatty-acyl-phospholipid synthase
MQDQKIGDLPRRSLPLHRSVMRALYDALGRPSVRLELWDGHGIGDPAASGTCRILDATGLFALTTDAEFQFGELYRTGRLVVEGDLVTFMVAVAGALNRAGHGPLWRRATKMRRRPRPNSLVASRENIYHHYDLGNDFYAAWLDPELVYTCAYYPTPASTLAAAQQAKLEHVCRKLWLRPGERVVEAGCGWGALALYMAHHGVSVRAYNISRAQLAWARDRAQREGLGDRVEFVEGDYRDIRGEFDVFVSVGMLEHVGADHYRKLGQVIDRCLLPTGRGLIHTIGQNVARPMNPWIERRIFPGAYPPTLREMMAIFEPFGFSVLDVENLRLHYARTTQDWLDRFEAALQGPLAGRFPPEFERTWRLYLAGSVAGFTAGDMQLFQQRSQSSTSVPISAAMPGASARVTTSTSAWAAKIPTAYPITCAPFAPECRLRGGFRGRCRPTFWATRTWCTGTQTARCLTTGRCWSATPPAWPTPRVAKGSERPSNPACSRPKRCWRRMATTGANGSNRTAPGFEAASEPHASSWPRPFPSGSAWLSGACSSPILGSHVTSSPTGGSCTPTYPP